MGKNNSKLCQDQDSIIKEATATREALINGSEVVPTSVEGEDNCYASVVEKEVKARSRVVSHIIDMMPENNTLPLVTAYIPFMLNDAIFCGHLVTDLDSIAGAIGAAELYGGIPARASEVNSETKFALDYWGMSAPLRIEDLVVSQPKAGICLVDHQQLSQLNPAIDPDRIVGVIDHHALQNSTIITERPIYMDIRPWGSMSTIIAHTFLLIQRRPRKCVAGMLLCAILSDTLNLLGPTTTKYDKMMVAILCEICHVTDINALAQKQFKAKSKELATLTARQLCQGDLKVFSFNTPVFVGTVGFAVIETTDDEVIIARKEELIEALKLCKAESNLTLIYLAIVNIVAMHSNLLLVGDNEKDLAVKSFPLLNALAVADPAVASSNESTHANPIVDNLIVDNNMLNLGTRVSRKNDFIPNITRIIKKEGWKLLLETAI